MSGTKVEKTKGIEIVHETRYNTELSFFYESFPVAC